MLKKSKESFEVYVPYKQEIIEFFKTIKGRKFDGLTLRWSFPIGEYLNVFTKLSDLCNMVEKVTEFPAKRNTAKYVKKD